MGVSTDGQICYGIVFEDGFKFPWSNDKYDDEIEEWWRDVNEYVNPLFNPFTNEGGYKDGVDRSDPRIDKYFEHIREWMQKNPIPIEIVNYCSGDCPMYILAISSSCKNNSRGYPLSFIPSELITSDKDHDMLIAFCNKYEIDIVDEPKWWLSSLWC